MDYLLGNLNDLRKAGEFCDVVLVSGNMKKHYGHRVILAAVSPYFRAMLTRDYKEKETGVVNLHDTNSATLDMLLNFIYSGKLDLREETALELYQLADRLQLKEVSSRCTDFLISHLHPSNCYGFKCLGFQCSDQKLLDASTRFLLHNFNEFTETEEFLGMEIDHFKDFILTDELNVRAESDVYRAVKKWVHHHLKDRKKHLSSLIHFIRFPLMKLEYLRYDIMSDKFLKSAISNQFLKKIYKFCVDYHKGMDSVPDEASKDSMCFSRTERIPAQVIFLVGGWNEGRTLDRVESFNPNSSTWILNDNIYDCRRCYYGMAEMNGEIYMTGGYDGQNYQASTHKFDPITMRWTELAPMQGKRCFASLVNLDNDLYAVAGFDGNRRLRTVERYSATENKWTKIRNTNTPRSDATAVALNNKIYVIGGFGNNSLSSVEYYNKTANAWYFISSMSSRRSGAGAVALPDGRLFVIGGFNGSIRLKSTEFYDPSTDRWTSGPEMRVARSNCGACVIGNMVYVIGGYTGTFTVTETERLDLTASILTWSLEGHLSNPRSAMRAVVLNGLPNMRDYLWPQGSGEGNQTELEQEYDRENDYVEEDGVVPGY